MRLALLLLLLAPNVWGDSSTPARHDGGKQRPMIPEPRRTGVLRVEVGPPGATVLLDGGALTGKGPYDVPFGMHRVTLLQYPRRADFTVRVRGGQDVVIKHSFATRPDPGTEVHVAMSRDKQLFVDGERVDRGEADFLLRHAASSRPDVRAVIEADASLPYAEVAAVMDLIKACGIKKVAMGVAPTR